MHSETVTGHQRPTAQATQKPSMEKWEQRPAVTKRFFAVASFGDKEKSTFFNQVTLGRYINHTPVGPCAQEWSASTD